MQMHATTACNKGRAMSLYVCLIRFLLPVYFPPPSRPRHPMAKFNLLRDKIVRFSKRPIQCNLRRGPRSSRHLRSLRKKESQAFCDRGD